MKRQRIGIVSTLPLLDAEEERELALRVRAGDEAARSELIERNARLAFTRAKRLQGRGLDLEDLVSEAYVALCKAADRFVPGKGAKFGTYATSVIDSELYRALENTSRPVRIPSWAHGRMTVWARVAGEIAEAEGRPAQPAEIAEATGDTAECIEAAMRARRVVSLPDMRGRRRSDEDGDWEPAAREDPPAAIVADEDERRACRAAVEELSDRTALVLKLRHGLDGEDASTTGEVGVVLGVTRERVRQIEVAALRDLAERLRPRRAV